MNPGSMAAETADHRKGFLVSELMNLLDMQ
jgi:hypothetical protein